MFRFKLGPIVGQRTWGEGRHARLPGADGRRLDHRANLAIWTPEEGWVVENEGVPPDIEVEQTPKDVLPSRDPQLAARDPVALDAEEEAPPTSRWASRARARR